MYFRGFSIELLEDGKQLREYCLQAKNTIIATGKSYVVDEETNERKYSPITAYAVVKESGKKFEIKYSARMANEDDPIIAIIYVDGTNDYVCHVLTSSSPQTINYFWDFSRNKKYYFEFSEVQSSPKPCLKPLYGGIGTVSIYFYKAYKITNKLTSMPYYVLSQSRIIEPRFRPEIKFTTKFNEMVDANVSTIPNFDVTKQSNDPIAVLHIHYRSESWLISIGMPMRDYDNSSMECTPNNNSFNPIPTVNGNELVLQSERASNQSVTAEMDVSLISDQFHNAASKLNESLNFLIQSFKLMNENRNRNLNENKSNVNNSVEVIEILDKENGEEVREQVHEKCKERNSEPSNNVDDQNNRCEQNNRREQNRCEQNNRREQNNSNRRLRNDFQVKGQSKSKRKRYQKRYRRRKR
ncbi:hypothetical protein RclHR1_01060013 [Rhizophagus clarus]|uniref:Uncharacterized protein n=1 Tax=Rhizophagus clarus TaxID=94130 RepID=A0A2Z6QE00_9GLOM|nr:hypothetical protein RclHR1_01060013 [Rhizophagus clarus]